MTLGTRLGPPRYTDSVQRVSQAAPTYVRTYGLTENLQDLNNSLALRNAHEKNADFDSIPRSNP